VSLVSDALKKAEREAAAREAREKGLPAPLETPVQPYRARRGQRGGKAWIAFAAGGAAAVVVAVLLARPASEREAPDKKATASTSASEAQAPPAPTPTAAPVAEPVAPSAATVAPPKPLVPAVFEPPAPSASEPSAPQAPPPSPRTTPSASLNPPNASEPRTRSEAHAPAPRSAKEFVRRVDLPDGSKLELGGIAYSETAPFAYLNGRLLKVGEGIAGYTLVAIERDRVVVRGAAGELTIRSKAR
jgi:hypothetical protein